MEKQTLHPMVKLQQKISSLVESDIVKPEDSISKIALLLGNDWKYWKNELMEFDFSVKDPIGDLLLVENWEE